MANAVVEVRHFPANTTGASAEGGLKLNRAAGTTATTDGIPMRSSTGTNFGWLKYLALWVTTISSPSQNITNRTVALTGALLAGIKLWYDGNATHAVADGSNMPAASEGVDDDDPGGAYAEITTTPAVYDADSETSGSTGKNGDYCIVVPGVSNLYLGTSGTNIAIGTSSAARSLTFGYDEM